MQEIIDHYTSVPEDSRLQKKFGPLEFVRTQEIVLRFLPAPPARVLDAGGGTGVYSEWLGSLGYETHVVDITPAHIETARRLPHVTSAAIGDARQVEFAADSVDTVLLFGPLYHLQLRADRVAALAEARRVLRPGGIVFTVAISRYASLLASLVEDAFDDPNFAAIIDRDLRDGHHINDTGNPRFFTTAFFHQPDELTSEVVDAGFSLVDLLAVEGPVWLAANFAEAWGDESKRERLLEWARRVEREPALLPCSAHLLAVARKPD